MVFVLRPPPWIPIDIRAQPVEIGVVADDEPARRPSAIDGASEE
jgi:hypothetical protein